jgi:hypothetical protein
MEELRELSNELGHPSAYKLWHEAQRRNLDVTRKEVFALARSQSARQVLQKRPKYEGKLVAVEINDRWAADIVDYNAHPSPDKKGGDPYQYILIVQDVFTREIFVHALKSKSQEVAQQAFASIVNKMGLPDRLDTDNGHEFKGEFHDYLVDEHIHHEIADPRNKNARGTLDAAIKSLRQHLARIQLAEGRRDWASFLQKAAESYNKTVHTSLIGRAPNEVYQDKDLQFDLRLKAAQDLKKNSDLIVRRAAQLERAGAFRDEALHKNKFERSFTPRFSDQVHRVQQVIGSTVIDEQGRSFPTRHVVPVPPESEAVDTVGMHGGSERIDRVRLQSLEPYRQQIEDFVGDGKTENEVTRYMKTLGMATLMHAGFNFRKALVLLGYTVGQGRGSSTALVTKAQPVQAAPAPVEVPRNGPVRRIRSKRAPLTPAEAAPIPVPRDGPLRRINNKRAPLTPAEAAANLRRRITGKRPGI